MTDRPHIEFFGAKPGHGPSGGILASTNYVFGVAGRQVVVEVYSSAVQTRDGRMDAEKIKIAATAFLELEAERFGWKGLPLVN